ncbi:putative uncharacterized protein C8orf44 [Plecturocebus cupreus]
MVLMKLINDISLIQWLMPVIPELWEAKVGKSRALWEAKAGGLPEVRSSKPASSTWRKRVSTKNTKLTRPGALLQCSLCQLVLHTKGTGTEVRLEQFRRGKQHTAVSERPAGQKRVKRTEGAGNRKVNGAIGTGSLQDFPASVGEVQVQLPRRNSLLKIAEATATLHSAISEGQRHFRNVSNLLFTCDLEQPAELLKNALILCGGLAKQAVGNEGRQASTLSCDLKLPRLHLRKAVSTKRQE